MIDTKWDYKTLRIKPGLFGSFDFEAVDDSLRREGMQGWELVNALPLGTLQPILLFFKRPR